MLFTKIHAVFFSATGTTKTITTHIADRLAEQLDLPIEHYDFTLPGAREGAPAFCGEDLVIFGTPVYAGRVPNVLLKYLDTFQGGGATAVPIVVYGNRNFDNALFELRDILERDGFHTIAAAAFIGEHSFSKILAAGRPDSSDLRKARSFADAVLSKISAETPDDQSLPIIIDGVPAPYGGYYQPMDRNKVPIDIRKVKPITLSNCTDCGICAAACPMGSINPENVREYTGICIKCGACIKKCPENAKDYDDAGYIYHKEELEEEFARRAEPVFFL